MSHAYIITACQTRSFGRCYPHEKGTLLQAFYLSARLLKSFCRSGIIFGQAFLYLDLMKRARRRSQKAIMFGTLMPEKTRMAFGTFAPSSVKSRGPFKTLLMLASSGRFNLRFGTHKHRAVMRPSDTAVQSYRRG